MPLTDELKPAGFAVAPPGWGTYQRDSLSDDDRAMWDARINQLGGQVVSHTMKSGGLRAGRMFARQQTVTYYLVPELPEEPS